MAGRRANGEGTIYRRKDGRYEGAVFLRTASGTHKRVRVYGHSRGVVRTQLNDLLARANRGAVVPESNPRLGAYLQQWLATTVAATCRPRTIDSYRHTVNRYLTPTLGTKKLTRLTVSVVQQAFAQWQERGASPRVLHEMRKVLGAALTQAQREELIDRNPARLLRLPRYEPKEVRPWTAQQLATFLAAAEGDPLFPAFVLVAIYGLRRSEVLGIRWQDVESDQRVIHIRHQIQRIDGTLRLTSVKTRAGARDLPLVPLVESALRLVKVGGPSELIFRTSTGNPVEPHNLARSFRRIVAMTDLPPITLHHVRHTTATLLARLNVPTRHAQQILGHANSATTQQIYQHANIDDQRVAITGVERLLTSGASRDGCRQLLPSRFDSMALFTTFASGGPGGTRFVDPLLKRPFGNTVPVSLTEVRALVAARSSARLLGGAAVICCRQSHDPARRS
jgi:integrase